LPLVVGFNNLKYTRHVSTSTKYMTQCLLRHLWECSNWCICLSHKLRLCDISQSEQTKSLVAQSWQLLMSHETPRSLYQCDKKPIFCYVIDHQNKHVKLFLWYPKNECGNNCDGFNKGKKNMVFHDGLIDHVKYYFIVKLPHVWKHNLPTLSKD
jgi:hypothetical protein